MAASEMPAAADSQFEGVPLVSTNGAMTHAQHSASLAALVFGALGVVFGDIGTSPLYTLKECLIAAGGAEATVADLYGILSLMFWALVMVVTVKYLCFVMRADHHGEGGIFALLAIVPERFRAYLAQRADHGDGPLGGRRCFAAVRRRRHHAGNLRARAPSRGWPSPVRDSPRSFCRSRAASSWRSSRSNAAGPVTSARSSVR